MLKFINHLREEIFIALTAVVSVVEAVLPAGFDKETERAVTIHLSSGSNVCAIVPKETDVAALLTPAAALAEKRKVSPAGVSEIFEAMQHAENETAAYAILEKALNA